MAASASLAPRYRSILVSSYHLILRSSAVLEVLPRRVGCTKTLPIAARRRAMKRQILLLALAQAALTTSVKRTIWPVPNCPSSYAVSSVDLAVFGVGGSNPLIFIEGQCTLGMYGDDWANYNKATCVGNGDIITYQYRDSTCTTLDADDDWNGMSTYSDGVCVNWGSGSGMFSCLVPTSAPTSAPTFKPTFTPTFTPVVSAAAGYPRHSLAAAAVAVVLAVFAFAS